MLWFAPLNSHLGQSKSHDFHEPDLHVELQSVDGSFIYLNRLIRLILSLKVYIARSKLIEALLFRPRSR
jgi:hypothetical protein